MRKTIETVTCDVCKKETINKTLELMVVFTTEQNEGRSCKHHFTNEKIDLCDNCLNEMLYNGKQLFAYGAMGCNTYYFNKED
jgi:hypothetical protein